LLVNNLQDCCKPSVIFLFHRMTLHYFLITNGSSVRTRALGSWPKQGLARLRAKREAWESHFMLLKVQKNVNKWALTFANELPFWELESQWTPKSSKGNRRGQNPLDWSVFNIIEKLLKHRCLKWAHMTHLDIWNTNYGQKKGQESN
jgi:hypothetical protein